MTYQPSIPTGTVDLDQDYVNIQTNFQQLDTQFGIDHVPFSDPSGTINGFHEDIHFNPVSTTSTNAPNNYVAATATPQGVPVTTPGFGQIFSAQVNDGINTDQSLYWISGGGRTIPLTRNLTPVSATNGYTCLPGGLILQWGQKNGFSGNWPIGEQTVTFATSNIAFPTSCFVVYTTFIGPTGTTTGDITINSVSNTSFKWQFNGSLSATFGGFYWVAIGN